jgi:NAD(P)-dependent dehydrogenase (short-subunit alcohol dehydrogenase family)
VSEHEFRLHPPDARLHEGRRALVTGATSGLGQGTAFELAAHGAAVAINHRGKVDEARAMAEAIQAGGGRAIPIAMDISVEDDVRRGFAEAREAFGGLDVLVNNAGIAGPTAPVGEYDAEAFAAVMRVNLQGTFLVTQRAVPLLVESGAGSIITMSSLAGRFGYPNRIGYSTTKWGLVGFAKTLAMELGPLGITSNTVHPGAVEGSRLQSVFQGRAAVSGRTVEEEMDGALVNQSVKQFIAPADIAALVLFLAGPHARTISGQAFPIDGDSKAAV